MKTIKKVIDAGANELEISHLNGFLRIENSNNSNYKGIKVYSSKGGQKGLNFKGYSSFSKDELIDFQNILLKAYVFINDELDESISKSESKDKLDEIKKIVLIVRKHLRYITNYIDSYDDIIREYKEI